MTKYLIVHKKTGEVIAEPRDLAEAQAVLMVDPERTEIREIVEEGQMAKLEKQVANAAKKDSK